MPVVVGADPLVQELGRMGRCLEENRDRDCAESYHCSFSCKNESMSYLSAKGVGKVKGDTREKRARDDGGVLEGCEGGHD